MQQEEFAQSVLCFTSWMTAQNMARSFLLYDESVSKGSPFEIYFLNVDRVNYELFNKLLRERNVSVAKVQFFDISRKDLYEQIYTNFTKDFDLSHASSGSFVYLLSLVSPEKFAFFGDSKNEDAVRDNFYQFWFSKLERRGDFGVLDKELSLLDINPLWDLFSTYEDIWYWEWAETRKKP